MGRLVTPAILLGAAAVVAWYNQRPDSKIIFPFLDLLSRDLATQGWITVGLLTALGAVAALVAAIGLWRDRRVD